MSHFPAGVHKGSISQDNQAPRALGRLHGGDIKPWNCTWPLWNSESGAGLCSSQECFPENLGAAGVGGMERAPGGRTELFPVILGMLGWVAWR